MGCLKTLEEIQQIRHPPYFPKYARYLVSGRYLGYMPDIFTIMNKIVAVVASRNKEWTALSLRDENIPTEADRVI